MDRKPRSTSVGIAVQHPSDYAIRWCHGWVNVSQVLAEECVGIEEVDDGVWAVYFGPLLLGRFVEKDLKLYSSYPYDKSL